MKGRGGTFIVGGDGAKIGDDLLDALQKLLLRLLARVSVPHLYDIV